MGRAPEIPDQYSQRTSRFVDSALLGGSSWTRNGITVTEQSEAGVFLLENAGADSEIYQDVTVSQAGPVCLSLSGKANTLYHVRPYLLNLSLSGRQLSDGYWARHLRADLFRRVHCRGQVAAAGNVIRCVLRIGRGYGVDLGSIYVRDLALEYAEVPTLQRLPDTTAAVDQEQDPMFYLRAENNSLQTHRRRKTDTARPLTVQLQDRDGNPIDLTSNTVVMRMFSEAADAVEINNRSCTIDSPATAGNVSVTLQSGDVDTVGRYFAQFVRTVGGLTEAIPPDKTFCIEVLPQI